MWHVTGPLASSRTTWHTGVRIATVVVIAAAVVFVFRAFPIDSAIAELQGWAATSGVVGMVSFGAAYVVLALLFVPGAVLTMVAGAMFGLGWGLLIVAIATSVADALAFLLGRSIARPLVVRLLKRYPQFEATDRAIGLGGWRIVALIRLNPTIPYSASNYLFGLTGLSFPVFLVSSGIFTLPGAFLYLYLGFVGAETLGGSTSSTMRWISLLLGLAITLVTVIYLTILARRELHRLQNGNH